MIKYFIDTNILIYSTIENHIHNKTAQKLLLSYDNLYISNQIIQEYINTITDKKKIGVDIDLKTAFNNIDTFLNFIRIVNNHNISYSDIKKLAITNNIDKRKIFDLQIYLTMKLNDIDNIITYNVKDFKIFNDINIIH